MDLNPPRPIESRRGVNPGRGGADTPEVEKTPVSAPSGESLWRCCWWSGSPSRWHWSCTFVTQVYAISGLMEPTLFDGERVMVDKVSPAIAEISRRPGDLCLS